MDKGTLGAISTVLVVIAFIGICWWAFSPKRKKRFDEDANLPFADEEPQARGTDEASESADAQTQEKQGRPRSPDDVEGRNKQ